MYGLEEAVTELNRWKQLGDYEHIKELVQAEKEGRLRILKPANENTCGMCKHYIPEKGAYGRCAVREFQMNRWGQNTGHKFVPGRSRHACRKDFVRKEDV